MEQISAVFKILFISFTMLTVWQFYRASNHSTSFLLLIGAWIILQCVVAESGFYANPSAAPPRIILQLLPALLFIVGLFLTGKGRKFIDQLNIKQITLIHTVRIPIEFVLYYLFIADVIPRVMTFEGRNFDIVAGLSAPFIVFLRFVRIKMSTKAFLVWNLMGLALLVNIVVIAVLSAKSSYQQFGFHHPNVALGYFPFSWLPSTIVPIILTSHLAAIRHCFITRLPPPLKIGTCRQK